MVDHRHHPGIFPGIFQKPLAAGTEWATFSLPLRTGAPFFLFERRFDGPVTVTTVCTPARFLFPQSSSSSCSCSFLDPDDENEDDHSYPNARQYGASSSSTTASASA